MDQHTLDILEFDRIRQAVTGYAVSPYGKQRAATLAPLRDHRRTVTAQQRVTEMVSALVAGLVPPFDGLHDVREYAGRAAKQSTLAGTQLVEVAQTARCAACVAGYRDKLEDRFPRLTRLIEGVQDLSELATRLEQRLDDKGNVYDQATPELAQVREQIRQLEERIGHTLERLLRQPEIRSALRFAKVTVCGQAHVLPVAVNHRAKVPGIVHRTSASGETVYVEPRVVAALNAELALLRSAEQKEINRVLRQLTRDVGAQAHPLVWAVEAIGELDFVCAKARYSRDYHMNEPELNDEGKLWLREARHPLLEILCRAQAQAVESIPPSQVIEKVVPIDVRLGWDYRLLIITGPNTGGKTVALKTAGLLCVMAQCGLHIPARHGSVVPFCSQVMADIGDEQSLEQSLSTFSAHMTRIADMLRRADARSLLLLDELGAGTDPMEGAALARAMLDELDRMGCLAMITTHLGDLKTYAFSSASAENAAAEFDSETLRPTYRLLTGKFGASNALKVAKRLNVPRMVLDGAYQYLRERRGRHGPALAQLEKARADAEKAREEALVATQDAEQARQDLEQLQTQLRHQAERRQTLLKTREGFKEGDRVECENLDRPGRIVRVDHKKNLALVSVGSIQWQVPLSEVYPEGWHDPERAAPDGSMVSDRE